MRFSPFILSTFALLPFLFVSAAPSSTPESEDTIGGLTLGAIINLLGIGIVTNITAIITLETLVTNLVSVNFDAKNPLPFELTIDRVVSIAGLNDTIYATFDQTFSESNGTAFFIPALGTKNSGTFGNVNLTQGAIPTLDIIPQGKLDLIRVDVFVRAATIDGKLGIPLEIDGLKQSGVPTTYELDLSLP